LRKEIEEGREKREGAGKGRIGERGIWPPRSILKFGAYANC